MIRACLRGFSTQPYATNDSRRPNVLGGVEQIAGIVLSLKRREPFVLGAVRRPHTALAFVRFLLHVVHIDALRDEWAQRIPDPADPGPARRVPRPVLPLCGHHYAVR